MRLDKFLKVSRLIKRRTVANEACDAARQIHFSFFQAKPIHMQTIPLYHQHALFCFEQNLTKRCFTQVMVVYGGSLY